MPFRVGFKRTAEITVAAANTPADRALLADFKAPGIGGDETTLQAAIDQAAAVGARTVRLLDGTFELVGPVALNTAGMQLIGAGASATRIEPPGAGDPMINVNADGCVVQGVGGWGLIDVGNNADRITIREVGTLAANDLVELEVSAGSQYTLIEQCHLDDVIDNGTDTLVRGGRFLTLIGTPVNSSYDGLRVDNLLSIGGNPQLSNIVSAALVTISGNDASLVGCRFLAGLTISGGFVDVTATRVSKAGTGKTVNVTAQSVKLTDVSVTGGGGIYYGPAAAGGVIRNCLVTSGQTAIDEAAIMIDGPDNVTVIGCQVSGTTQADGIQISASNFSMIAACKVSAAARHGISLRKAASDSTRIEACYVSQCSLEAANTYDGIHVANLAGMNHNGITACTVRGSLDHRYGLRLDGANVNNCLAAQNDLVFAAVGANYSNAGTGTDVLGGNRV